MTDTASQFLFSLSRRRALRAAGAAIVAPAFGACGGSSMAQGAPVELENAIRDFAALEPETTSVLIQADVPDDAWTASYAPQRQLFIGSAVKTFILAQFLRDSEVARNGVTEQTPVEISDRHRSAGGGVFEQLSGISSYRNVLEAMITHSDNTATDIAIAHAEPDRVRALIAQAGLGQTQIPDSTRMLFSYLAGAPLGVDIGWDGIQNLDSLPYTRRTDVINPNVSMLSSANDLVSWYRQVLSGKFFSNAGTLREFKRISAMANAMALVPPEDTVAYGKGGSIDWEGFHCICVPGQMRVRDVAVTFCFTINWKSNETDTGSRSAEIAAPMARALAAAADSIKQLYPRKA
ncbi:serine hydrolase [Cupriavidus sp. AU9028]|uniref:serine hydrolase n=1 Tax=Cupriavidus sp. AU9028 TaxID=2871157 RepID=UPI001C96F9F6|nr:serine hydrolase [Cupriavidus sp. AU9028]MBY4897207.1 serine hydrolase [Cupriavidus sp. AU9028]